MFQPELAEQSVVSILNVLGIGIYNPDGSVIRVGRETSDADLYLFEPEVRGLIDMLEETDQPETWFTFRDFHAALASLGLQASAEELAAAYADAYAANPEAPIAQFVMALTYPDPDAQMTRFSAWLLFLDGFVPPHPNLLAAGPGFFAASPAPGGGGWGAAQNNVQALPGAGLPEIADPHILHHLITFVSQSSITVTANPGTVHEGHGGEGAPTEIKATLHAWASPFTSPFTFHTLIPLQSGFPANVPVEWVTGATADKHGSFDFNPLPRTDNFGESKRTYTPRKEPADGQGALVQAVALIQARVSGGDLVTWLYGRPDLAILAPGLVLGFVLLNIEYHEVAMDVTLTNHYDVTIEAIIGDTHATGTDTFSGRLAKQEDGTWQGTVSGTADGSQFSNAFGEYCSSTWFATQQVEVIGEPAPDSVTGDFVFRFYPVSEPVGSMGSGRCPPTRHKQNGVSYAPYNDYGISQPDAGQGVFIILPQDPGGVADYPVPNPGHGITITNTSWHVEIQFIQP
jgi:hypothetical protein